MVSHFGTDARIIRYLPKVLGAPTTRTEYAEDDGEVAKAGRGRREKTDEKPWERKKRDGR
jgi:hypothetical protein